MKRNYLFTSLLIVLLAILIVLSVAMGSVKIPVTEVINSFFNPNKVNSTTVYIVKNLRLPRAFCCVFAGSILALSGMAFQCVFRNPMADSYILGISSGASASVALALLLGVSLTSSVRLPVVAILGSLLCSFFIFATNRKNYYSILLTGIAVNFFLSALTTLFVHLGHGTVDAVMYWTMGSLSNSSYTRVLVLGLVTLFYYLICLGNSKAMDILLLDDSTAFSSGLDINKKRIFLLATASISTAIVVSYCGVIGFIGLMSPHLARLTTGPVHKKLAPAAMLTGADILLLSDIISRTAASPSELPVGIVTSLLGAPVFFILLKRRNTWTQKH